MLLSHCIIKKASNRREKHDDNGYLLVCFYYSIQNSFVFVLPKVILQFYVWLF